MDANTDLTIRLESWHPLGEGLAINYQVLPIVLLRTAQGPEIFAPAGCLQQEFSRASPPSAGSNIDSGYPEIPE